MPISPENAREAFLSTAKAFKTFFGGEKERQRLLDILQNNDSTVRDVLATCVNEENVIKAFVFASFKNDVELLQAFYDVGMNLNVTNAFGDTALTTASHRGQKESVRWLLDHDVDVDMQDDNGWTALICASAYGNTKVVEMLLEKNANPDIQDKSGHTALMQGSRNCRLEVLQVLLRYNVNTDFKNKSGKTALDLAKDEEVKELLQNHVTTSYVLK